MCIHRLLTFVLPLAAIFLTLFCKGKKTIQIWNSVHGLFMNKPFEHWIMNNPKKKVEAPTTLIVADTLEQNVREVYWNWKHSHKYFHMHKLCHRFASYIERADALTALITCNNQLTIMIY